MHTALKVAVCVCTRMLVREHQSVLSSVWVPGIELKPWWQASLLTRHLAGPVSSFSILRQPHYVGQAGLDVTIKRRLALNLCQPSCYYLPGAVVTVCADTLSFLLLVETIYACVGQARPTLNSSPPASASMLLLQV